MFVTLQFRSITNLVSLSAAAIPQLIMKHCGPTLESADHLLDLFRTEHAQYVDLQYIVHLIRLLACATQSPVKV
jgi:hypothetical protein